MVSEIVLGCSISMLVLGIVCSGWCCIMIASSIWRRAWLPPSIQGLPLLGHLHLMPAKRPWIWFNQVAKRLGSPIIYLNLAGQDIIVVNDYHTALDLLGSKSAIYSSRPRMVLLSDYVSTGKQIALLPYGTKWRTHRSALHREMTPPKIKSYTIIQMLEARILMHNLYLSPNKFMESLKQYTGNVILRLTYGLESDSTKAVKAVKDVTKVLDDIAKIVNPANIVDIFPVLDRLPDLLAPWRSKVIIQRNHNQAVYRGLLQNVLDDVSTGKLRPEETFASRLWIGRDKLGMDDLDIAYLAGTMFEAATDTTFSALATFVLAAITYPEVFKAAQQEVDRVCKDQPPSMEHFEALEYIRAMCKETLRWRTVSAGGFPHASTALRDDWFHGYRIPAGSIIIPNHWGMSLSSVTYGKIYDPLDFEPRRWIEQPQGVGDLSEGHPAFGFGRRTCPGRKLAVNSIYLVIAHLCYYFDIKEKDGVDIDTYAYTTGGIVEPEPFECSMTPREGRIVSIETQAANARDRLKGMWIRSQTL